MVKIIFSLALFQCSVIPPVLHCSAPLFHGFSIVLAVFRCSGVVLSFRGYSEFPCSGGVPLFPRCSIVPRVFRVPSFRVPVFLVL